MYRMVIILTLFALTFLMSVANEPGCYDSGEYASCKIPEVIVSGDILSNSIPTEQFCSTFIEQMPTTISP